MKFQRRRASSAVSPPLNPTRFLPPVSSSPGIVSSLLLVVENSNGGAAGSRFRKSNGQVWTGEERARSRERGGGVRGRGIYVGGDRRALGEKLRSCFFHGCPCTGD